MEGVIMNYRRARHHQTTHHMIISVPSVSSREDASKLVGKTVSWTTPSGKKIVGKIAAPHGNSGAVRSIMDSGMPGQSLGTKIAFE